MHAGCVGVVGGREGAAAVPRLLAPARLAALALLPGLLRLRVSPDCALGDARRVVLGVGEEVQQIGLLQEGVDRREQLLSDVLRLLRPDAYRKAKDETRQTEVVNSRERKKDRRMKCGVV